MGQIDVILRAAWHGESPDLGSVARRVSAERAAVEQFIAHGGEAYGFTTRLGHLDDERIPDDDLNSLLVDHLHGVTFAVDAGVLRVIAGAKVAQLARGGSGITRDMFEAIAAYSRDRSEGMVQGAWDASYGAGDVVPAAWWIRAIVDATGVAMSRGDVIAAINGTFFSTGVAVLALARAVDTVAQYLAFLPPHRSSVSSGDAGVDELLASMTALAPSSASAGQLPVSERDALPYARAVAVAIENMTRAVDWRLARPSSNPLFVFPGRGVVRPESQNGFLDFGLTFAASGLVQMLAMACGHLQRLIEHAAARTAGARLVQAPKVAEAVVVRLGAIGIPERFSGALSHGIEDMYDQSLSACINVLRAARCAEDLMQIAVASGIAPAPAPPIRSVLARMSGVTALPVGAAAVWTEPFIRAG